VLSLDGSYGTVGVMGHSIGRAWRSSGGASIVNSFFDDIGFAARSIADSGSSAASRAARGIGDRLSSARRGIGNAVSNMSSGMRRNADSVNVRAPRNTADADVNTRALRDEADGQTFCPFPQKNSFSADTLVSTADGKIAIAEVEVGDTVYAYDPETGLVNEYTVTHTWEHDDDSIVTLTIDGEVIETTPWHPFYTDHGWITAGALDEGDQVLSLDGSYGTVESVVVEVRTATK
jgi:hypothetical protein